MDLLETAAVQSIAWAVLAILGVALYTCKIEIDFEITNPLYYLYFIYFFDRDCADIPGGLNLAEILKNSTTLPPDVTIPPYETTPLPIPLPDWPQRFVRADDTNTLMSLYVGFNAAWAVTCIILVVAAAKRVRNWFAYIPWILLTAANIVLDVTAMIGYASDADASKTARGLLENVIGVDLNEFNATYVDILFNQTVFTDLEGFTMIPSIVMAILSSRLGILLLLNLLFLICVPLSICQLPNQKNGKSGHLPTYPNTGPRSHGFHNKSYIEEPHTNKPGPRHDHTNDQVDSRPTYFAGDFTRSSTPPTQPPTNRGPASSAAQPPAPGDSYGWQALNRTEDEQKRAPNTRWGDSEGSNQPSTQNRPAASFSFPRVDPHSFAPRTDGNEPRPSRKPSIPHDVRGNNEPDGQRMAPHLHRKESDRPLNKPPPPVRNRRPAPANEVHGPQDHNNNADRRVSGSNHHPSGSQPPEELRSQLPWSYFGPRNAPMRPKPKHETVNEENVDMPPVPVPDYTLHFGKTARPAQPKVPDDAASVAGSVASHHGTSAFGVDRRSSLLESNRH